MARWLEERYPAIEARARKNKAVILWLDQTGLRSDASLGKGWAPTGQTPVVAKTGRRFSVNVIAAISNRGELYFTCYRGSFYRGSFTRPVFLIFLDRLVRHLGRKIHLIVDGTRYTALRCTSCPAASRANNTTAITRVPRTW